MKTNHPLYPMTRSLLSLVLFSLILMAGCASAKKMAKEPHAIAGIWSYSLDTPQGVYTGKMMFMEEGDALQGTIADDESPDQLAPLQDVVFNAETSTLTFNFDGGEFGTMKVTTKLEGDKMMGTMNVGAYGVDVVMEAARQTE